MANTIPFNSAERQPDRPDREGVPPSADSSGEEKLRQEYTSEEVTEIIRVALQSATDGDQSTVNKEEMLAIAGDFGLSAADLVRASEAIAASREETDRISKAKQLAMQDFKLNVVGYAVGIVGLFFLNWFTSTEFWWFIIPAIAYGPVVAVHGYIAKYNPDHALSLLRPETHGPSKEGSR